MRILSILFLICLFFPTRASAAEIDFSTVMLNLGGKPYQDCNASDVKADPPKCIAYVDLTLGRMCANALNAGDRNLKLQDLVSRGLLAKKLFAGGKVTLGVDDIALIKTALGSSGYQPNSIAEAVAIIDPDSLKTK